MNYKVLPLLAILSLMVIPASNFSAFGDLNGIGVTIFNQANNGVEMGNLDPFATPHGMVANEDGNFLAYRVQSNVEFAEEKFVFFSKTTDGGSTWSTPLNVTGTQMTGFEYNIDHVTIFANATTDTIDILYSEQSSGGDFNIMHIRSTNNGDSFGSPTIIEGAVRHENQVWFAVSGDDIFVLYRDDNANDLKFKGSYDGGATFPTETVIDDATGGGTLPSGSFQNLVMQTGGGGTGSSALVWIVFTASDTTNFDTDVYASYSVDGGGAWTSLETVSQEGTQVNEGQSFQTHLFVDYVANDVLILFQGLGGGGTPYLSQAYSANNGVSYSAQENIELGIVCNWGFINTQSQVASYDGTNIQVICAGENVATGVDIMQSVSTDFGDNYATFQSIIEPSLQEVNVGGFDAVGTPIIIEAVGDMAYATWTFEDASAGEADRTAYAVSSNAGTDWTTVNIGDLDGQSGFRSQLQGFGSIVYLAYHVNDILFGFFEAFTPPDVDIPVIEVSGDNPLTVQVGFEYSDPSATCIDPTEGDISGSIIVSGDEPDTGSAGSFDRTYDCDDGSANSAVQVILTVNVLADTDNPTITLLGSNPQEMNEGASYSENGATCIDPSEGDITGNVVVDQNDLDVDTRGTYTVLYDCQDSVGNNAPTVQRTLVVNKSSQGISSGTTSGGNQGLGGTTDVLTLDDVEEPTVEDIQEPARTPLLQFGDDGTPTGTTSGQSISDIFANLFTNQLNAQTGEIEDGASRTLGDDIRDFFAGTPSPDTIAGEERTERQETAGVNIINTIQNFFSNFFN